MITLKLKYSSQNKILKTKKTPKPTIGFDVSFIYYEEQSMFSSLYSFFLTLFLNLFLSPRIT